MRRDGLTVIRAWFVVIVAMGATVVPLVAIPGQSPHAVGTGISVSAPPPDTGISVELKNVTVEDAIYEIAAKARLAISWSRSTVPLSGRVSVSLRDASVTDAFAKVLRGSGATAKLSADGKTVLIVRAPKKTASQDTTAGTIAGRVADSVSGNGVAGVTVTLQGANRSAVTDRRGGFTFPRVPAGEWIVIVKRLGYASVTRAVTVIDGQTTTFQIVLREAPNMLSGVVTTATGQQRKLEVGNNIVTLDVDSIMQTAPIRSVVDLLDGRVPGMTVQRTSGSPGDPARIRLRGTGSIYANNDPIIVVDGIRMYGEQSNERNANVLRAAQDTSRYATPSPLDQIDPNIIEKIEVLKGPSAASLYGSDAANGVIVITTKKGGGGARWSVTGDHGLSYVPGKWPIGLWPFGKSAVSDVSENCAEGNSSGFGCTTIDSIVSFQALNEKYFTAAGRGHGSGATISFLGGRGGSQYAYTASARDEVGLLKLPTYEVDRYFELSGRRAPGWMKRPERLKSWSLSATGTTQLTDAATVSVTSVLNNAVQDKTGLSDSFNSAIGQLSRMWIDQTRRGNSALIGQPYEQASSDQTNVTIGAQVQWQPLTWLPLVGSAGVNMLTKKDKIFLRAEDDPLLLQGIVVDAPTGRLRAVDGEALNRTVTLNTTIPLQRRLSLALGVNYQSQRIADAQGYFEGFGQGIDNPSSGALQDRLDYTRTTSDRKTFGWFVEPQFAFSSRFFVMPGIRLDNNGLSGKNARLNTLPKMNFSWVASDERFFPFKRAIDLFRVRTAFGVAGVQPTAQDRFRLLEEVTIETTGAGAAFYRDMLKLAGLGNTRLRPERSGEIEGGFDTELLRGRVKVDATLYRKVRHDAIVGLPLASSIGSGEIKINLGVVENRGAELGVDAQILEGRNLGWNVGASLSSNSNKVVRLNGTDQTLGLLQGGGLSVFTQVYRVGYPMNGAWTTPIQSYHDLDGDGLLTASEVLVGDSAVFMGSKEPRRTAAIRSGFTLLGGRVALHTSFNYTGGMTQTDGVSAPCVSGFQSNCNTARALARYNNDAPLDEQAAAVALYSYGSAFGFMRNVSTWRFQTASLNVNLGSSVARYVRARSASVSLQGANLGLWTNYRGKDPNVNGYTWGNNTADLGQLPQPRTWSLRVSLGN